MGGDIASRIRAAFKDGESKLSFVDLAQRVYPNKSSWRYSANGGPPGCFMALSAALRRYGFIDTYSGGKRVVLRPATTQETPNE